LKKHRVQELMKPASDLVIVEPENTVEEALEILSNKGITSAPVFDPNQQKLTGTISIMDICLALFGKEMEEKETNKNKLGSTVLEVMKKSQMEPFSPIRKNETLDVLIHRYFKESLHRIPVIDEQGDEIVGFIAQSDLIRFFSEHLKEIQTLASKKLKDLGLDENLVSFIEEESTLSRAFESILETGYSGLPVVNKEGKLVNSFSASDLKRIKNLKMVDLDMTLGELFEENPLIPLVRCQPETSLGEVISSVSKAKVHRTFVVDEQGKPVSVISLTSILRVFDHPGSVSFA